MPKLPIGGEVGAEIRNAIQAGKEVTFHEARIHEHGWSGYGYSIVDPETGAGAYLIEGKGNGGALYYASGLLSAAGIILGPILFVLAVLTGVGFIAFFGILIGILATFISTLNIISALHYGDDDQQACFIGGFFLSLGIILGGLGASLGAGFTVFSALWPQGSIPQCMEL